MRETKTIPRINFEQDMREKILAASGRIYPELILKNGSIVNVFTNQIEKNDVAIYKGYIIGIGIDIEKTWESGTEADNQDSEGNKTMIIDCKDKIICPGLIDGHIHIESSMLTPGAFAAAVIPRGTTAVVTDPHEIANVAGEEGINYMLSASEGLPLDIFFMVPSCVPATAVEESGAVLEAEQMAKYFKESRVLGLAELMNSYGTVRADEKIIRKVTLALNENKLIDGHGPSLKEKDLNSYITAGVKSDHECTTIDEAMTKLKRGQ